jgi:hypothetical protein
MRAYCTDQDGTIVEELPEQGSAFQDGLRARSSTGRSTWRAKARSTRSLSFPLTASRATWPMA